MKAPLRYALIFCAGFMSGAFGWQWWQSDEAKEFIIDVAQIVIDKAMKEIEYDRIVN